MTHSVRRGARASATAVVAAVFIACTVLGSRAGIAGAAPTPIPVGTPPVAVITIPGAVYTGIPVTLSGASSTASSGTIAEWEWDLDGDGRFEHASTSTPWVTKTFRTGPRVARLRVTNEGGLVATATKSFTVHKPATAVVAPLAPTAVTAAAAGTTIEVTWQEPLGSPPLAYRVSKGSGNDNIVYVPATQPNHVTFESLVPGTYSIAVAAVNAAGVGPAGESEATIRSKGTPSQVPAATHRPAPGSSSEPGSTSASPPGSATSPATPGAGTDSTSGRSTVGFALVGVGVALLLVAGGTALLGMRRRGKA